MMASSCKDDCDLDPGYRVGEWNLCPPEATLHCPLCASTLVDGTTGIYNCPACRTSALWRASPWDPSRLEIAMLDEWFNC